jgi:uncharacterized protein (DUF2267 family)
MTTRAKNKKKAKSAAQPKRRMRPAKRVRSAAPADQQQINTRVRVHSTVTGTRVFDRTLHKTNVWLKDVMCAMNWENRERAYSALRATLHALRDILPIYEAVDLGAQLPILLRGVYYEGWNPKREVIRLKNIAEFYELVRYELGRGWTKFSNDELKEVVAVSLETLTRHVAGGEMKHIKGILQKKLRDLIPIGAEGQQEDLFPRAQIAGRFASLEKREEHRTQ